VHGWAGTGRLVLQLCQSSWVGQHRSPIDVCQARLPVVQRLVLQFIWCQTLPSTGLPLPDEVTVLPSSLQVRVSGVARASLSISMRVAPRSTLGQVGTGEWCDQFVSPGQEVARNHSINDALCCRCNPQNPKLKHHPGTEQMPCDNCSVQ